MKVTEKKITWIRVPKAGYRRNYITRNSHGEGIKVAERTCPCDGDKSCRECHEWLATGARVKFACGTVGSFTLRTGTFSVRTPGAEVEYGSGRKTGEVTKDTVHGSLTIRQLTKEFGKHFVGLLIEALNDTLDDQGIQFDVRWR